MNLWSIVGIIFRIFFLLGGAGAGYPFKSIFGSCLVVALSNEDSKCWMHGVTGPCSPIFILSFYLFSLVFIR